MRKKKVINKIVLLVVLCITYFLLDQVGDLLQEDIKNKKETKAKEIEIDYEAIPASLDEYNRETSEYIPEVPFDSMNESIDLDEIFAH